MTKNIGKKTISNEVGGDNFTRMFATALDIYYMTRFKKMSEKEKFVNLINKDHAKLIVDNPIGELNNGKAAKLYRSRINNVFRKQALLTLHKVDFINDVLSLARRWSLSKKVFITIPTDFFEYHTLPAINFWNFHLVPLTLAMAKKRNLSLEKGFDLQRFFEKDLEALMGKYDFEEYWAESLKGLLLSGEWYLPRHASIIYVEFYDDSEVNKINPKVSLKIFKDTPSDEVKMRWKEIETLRKEIYPGKRKRNKSRKEAEKLLGLNDLELGDLVEKEMRRGGYGKTWKAKKMTMSRLERDAYEIKSEALKKIPDAIQRRANILKIPITKEYIF